MRWALFSRGNGRAGEFQASKGWALDLDAERAGMTENYLPYSVIRRGRELACCRIALKGFDGSTKGMAASGALSHTHVHVQRNLVCDSGI